jgi:hypothetical protein
MNTLDLILFAQVTDFIQIKYADNNRIKLLEISYRLTLLFILIKFKCYI